MEAYSMDGRAKHVFSVLTHVQPMDQEIDMGVAKLLQPYNWMEVAENLR